MAVFVIFVEGADTEPAKLPVYIVESEEHASLICEEIKVTEYGMYDFSFHHCTRSDRGKFAFWAKMTFDAQAGVYGNIVAGIYDMIDEAYSIMSGRRSREKIDSGADIESDDAVETPVITEPENPATARKTQPEIKLETKSRSWLIESRALKTQYDQGNPDSAIIKKAKNWFSREWDKKANADDKKWRERLTESEQQELIQLKSFFASKWKINTSQKLSQNLHKNKVS